MKLKCVSAAVAAVLLASVVGTASAAHADGPVTVYVATSGSDTNVGTADAPFSTLQHAVDVLSGTGGTVVVSAGVYAQQVSVHGTSGIAITGAPGGPLPTLDGSSLTVPTGRSAMIDIADSTNISVSNLEITGYRTSDIDAFPMGVYVHGGDTGVAISGLHVHDLGNDNGTQGSMAMNAHGIAAYGDSPTQSISNLTISGNEVDNLVLGASESVVVNGNVDGWRITGNHIHDNNNIGIDAIGFEPTLSDPYRYTDVNRARNGEISGNDVENISSKTNPAYSGGLSADGIYVDGGTQINIDHNTTNGDDIGIEVAAENANGYVDHVNVTNNTVSNSNYVGISTGGYCDGDQSCGGVQTGASYSNTFSGNILRNNNATMDGSPQFLIQYHESNNQITGNTICATGSQTNLLGTVDRSTSGAGDVVNNNTYSAAVGADSAQWGWQGATYTGFDAYRAATGLDANSTYSATC